MRLSGGDRLQACPLCGYQALLPVLAARTCVALHRRGLGYPIQQPGCELGPAGVEEMFEVVENQQ